MAHFIALFSILSLAFAAPGNVSLQSTIGGRIVGGNETDIKDVPYQASLLLNGSLFCGAVIIKPDTILTAAHCVRPSVLTNIHDLSFRVGSSQWRSGGERIAAKKVVIHELFKDCPECDSDYDIAVVKLAKKIEVPFAVPIPLVGVNKTFPPGTLATVSGWGTTIFNVSAYPTVIRKVNVPIVSEASCRSAYPFVNYRYVCAGFTDGGKDACSGDSGGPLIAHGKLIGVVSFGEQCALPKFPGVYSSIGGFRDWIHRHANI